MLIDDSRGVSCDSGAGEDEEQLLVMGMEYKTDWQVLVEDLSRILGAESGWRNMEECAKKGRWLCCWVGKTWQV